MNRLGIRKEEKPFETRVPLVPNDIKRLVGEHGIEIIVEPSAQRAFDEDEFVTAGAKVGLITGDTTEVILGVKEMPLDFFEPEKAYLFFSHTIKGQPANMPMLQKILDVGATLIDYEKITDENGRRLVFFGNWAGLAGMSDTLRILGERLDYEGITPNPFKGMKPTLECKDLHELREVIHDLAKRIESEGLPPELDPLVFGFAGYGHVSQGAQDIFDILPHIEVTPDELSTLTPTGNKLYKCVFKEEDMVEPKDEGKLFDLQDYYTYGAEKYRGIFHKHVPFLTVLVNCIYWTNKYPRLITKSFLHEHWNSKDWRLKLIGDISCDVNGAIEFTEMSTKPDNPAFTYIVANGSARLGVAGDGPVVIAVDNLPCELPRESSTSFSNSLTPYIPSLAVANFGASFDDLNLPREIKDAVVVYRGELTARYSYLDKYLH
ncbi:MAG: hypothetical protein K9W43_08625 [Candidatus Thorarchaeota archaeon]|nr:hypothetical protein [Candidatus Thorarchaeota archaeon]